MATLLQLAKKLDFKSETEYFDYCINSYYNGQFTQTNELFKAMTRKDRKELLNYVAGCFDNHTEKDIYKYLFNKL